MHVKPPEMQVTQLVQPTLYGDPLMGNHTENCASSLFNILILTWIMTSSVTGILPSCTWKHSSAVERRLLRVLPTGIGTWVLPDLPLYSTINRFKSVSWSMASTKFWRAVRSVGSRQSISPACMPSLIGPKGQKKNSEAMSWPHTSVSSKLWVKIHSYTCLSIWFSLRNSSNANPAPEYVGSSLKMPPCCETDATKLRHVPPASGGGGLSIPLPVPKESKMSQRLSGQIYCASE